MRIVGARAIRTVDEVVFHFEGVFAAVDGVARLADSSGFTSFAELGVPVLRGLQGGFLLSFGSCLGPALSLIFCRADVGAIVPVHEIVIFSIRDTRLQHQLCVLTAGAMVIGAYRSAGQEGQPCDIWPKIGMWRLYLLERR